MNFNFFISLFPALLPLYLVRFNILGVPTTLLEILFLALLIWAIVKKKIKLNAGHYTLPAALFLIAATIGIFISSDTRAAFGIWKAYFIEPIIFFLLYSQNINKDDLKRSLRFLLITISVIAFAAIGQKFFGFSIPHPWAEELRTTSIYPYPNAIGLFLAPLVVLIFFLRKFVSSFFWRPLVLLVLALGVLATIFSKSESAWIAMAAGLAVGSILIGGLAKKTTIIVGIIGLLSLLFVPTVRNPVEEKLLLRDWSGVVRKITWNESFEMLKDRPIFGAGVAGYQKKMAPYHKTTAIEIFLYPHNIFLNFWSEVGLLGLIAFFWIVARFFIYIRGLLKRDGLERRVAIAAGSTMVALLIHGLVDVPYFKNDLSMLFWFIVAVPIISVANNISEVKQK